MVSEDHVASVVIPGLFTCLCFIGHWTDILHDRDQQQQQQQQQEQQQQQQ